MCMAGTENGEKTGLAEKDFHWTQVQVSLLFLTMHLQIQLLTSP